MKQGRICLKIASLNPDNLGNYNKINTIMNEIGITNIDMACMQETRNSRIDMVNVGVGDYAISPGGGEGEILPNIQILTK